MRRDPKRAVKKFSKGQIDHIDAWLMSYADMITLLFIVVVVAIPVTMKEIQKEKNKPQGEPEHPYHVADHTGLLSVTTIYDEAYRSIFGVIISNKEEENISIEKTNNGLWIDVAISLVFEEGTADVREEQLPLIRSLIYAVRDNIPTDSRLEIEGYTNDEPLISDQFANSWELSSMQTAKMANLFIAEGIDSKRLKLISYADNEPIVPNVDEFGIPIEKNRTRNQRIVIRIEVPKPEQSPKSLN